MISKRERRGAAVLEAPYHELAVAVHSAEAANIDETSWRQDRLKTRPWVTVTRLATVFTVVGHRSGEVARAFSGSEPGQVVGSDRFSRGQDGEAVPPHESVEPGRVGLDEGGGDVLGVLQAPPSPAIARSGAARRRRKQPVLRQQFLNSSPPPHGHGSLRPSFSVSSLSPWTTLRPRLTWVSLRIPPTPLGHDLERSSRLRRTRGAWHTSSLSSTTSRAGAWAGTASFRPRSGEDKVDSFEVRGSAGLPSGRAPIGRSVEVHALLLEPAGQSRLRDGPRVGRVLLEIEPAGADRPDDEPEAFPVPDLQGAAAADVPGDGAD